MRSERKARISGLAGTEHAPNRTLPDLTFPVTEWDLGTRLDDTTIWETNSDPLLIHRGLQDSLDMQN